MKHRLTPMKTADRKARNKRKQKAHEAPPSFKATKYRPTPNTHQNGQNERKRKNADLRTSFTRAEWVGMHHAEVQRGHKENGRNQYGNQKVVAHAKA